MSEQDGTQVSTKRRRSRNTNSIVHQNDKQAINLQRPASDDAEAWKTFWKAQGQAWRTEPEIDTERQKYLGERGSIKPDIEQGIYPFKNVKLRHADVEWLLATHENGRGPVDWKDENQRQREGVDLRGADLDGVDLSDLPLARMHGGLNLFVDGILQSDGGRMLRGEWWEEASIHLEGAWLKGAHLEQAYLRYAHLNEANLENAYMFATDLEDAHMEKSFLSRAHMEKANLKSACLKEADLTEAHLEEAALWMAQLDGAHLSKAHFEGANMREAKLAGADITHAYFDPETDITDITLTSRKYLPICVEGVHWNGVDITGVRWTKLKKLGDEWGPGEFGDHPTLPPFLGKLLRHIVIAIFPIFFLDQCRTSVRAYHQLALQLRSQGLHDEADQFAYRANVCQRRVLLRQLQLGRYFFSGVFGLLTGYGYKPGRSIFWYLVVIFGFARAYYLQEHTSKLHLSGVGSLIFSITAFHGRGFFLGGDFGYDSLVTILAALEAVIGLLIEISFIATFTQRFFGR